VRAFTFKLASKLGSIESVARSFAGARVWSCVQIQWQKAHQVGCRCGRVLGHGKLVCGACLFVKWDHGGPSQEDHRGRVKGAGRLTDEDGDRVLRGVGCSTWRRPGSQDMHVWAPSSLEWGGVGAVMHIPTNSLVILVF
jgi:hypothetical protein